MDSSILNSDPRWARRGPALSSIVAMGSSGGGRICPPWWPEVVPKGDRPCPPRAPILATLRYDIGPLRIVLVDNRQTLYRWDSLMGASLPMGAAGRDGSQFEHVFLPV
jgi:hypothetical protein